RPRVKGDKIDVRNIDMSKVEMLELEETSGKAYALKACIGRLKAQMVNAYYAQRIIDVFEKNPNTPLNKESINEIFSFDADAA
ncbi:MAG: transposase, partial [Prevotella denticola]